MSSLGCDGCLGVPEFQKGEWKLYMQRLQAAVEDCGSKGTAGLAEWRHVRQQKRRGWKEHPGLPCPGAGRGAGHRQPLPGRDFTRVRDLGITLKMFVLRAHNLFWKLKMESPRSESKPQAERDCAGEIA